LHTNLGEDRLYGENIAIREASETQSSMADAEADFAEEQAEKADRGL
jgi:hypothetical protein